MIEIEFISTDRCDFFPPKPAINDLPEWFRTSHGYIGGKKIYANVEHEGVPTLKKCMPLFDAMTSGYFLYSQSDISFENENGYKTWQYSDSDTFAPIDTHKKEQLQNYPIENKTILKFLQPYSIKTPKGYSCFVINPIHRGLPFRIFEGVVDTDVYGHPINLPFYFIEEKFTGLIPAGTPIAQVIPFKREEYKMVLGQRNPELAQIWKRIVRVHFYEVYKKYFWNKKEYK